MIPNSLGKKPRLTWPWRLAAGLLTAALVAAAARYGDVSILPAGALTLRATVALQVVAGALLGTAGVVGAVVGALGGAIWLGQAGWPLAGAAAAALVRAGIARGAWARFEAQPRLLIARDWWVWLLCLVLGGNLLGAATELAPTFILGQESPTDMLQTWLVLASSDALATWLLGTLLCKFLSPLAQSRAERWGLGRTRMGQVDIAQIVATRHLPSSHRSPD